MWVGFDLDNTLTENTNFLYRRIEVLICEFFKSNGIDISLDKVTDIVWNFYYLNFNLEQEERNINSYLDTVDFLASKFNLTVDLNSLKEKILNLVNDVNNPLNYSLTKDTEYVLSTLLERKYSLYLVTHGDYVFQVKKLLCLGIGKYFEEIHVVPFYKSKEPYIKPNSIFVGDSLINDILPAKDKAIPVLFEKNNNFVNITTIKDLRSLLDIL